MQQQRHKFICCHRNRGREETIKSTFVSLSWDWGVIHPDNGINGVVGWWQSIQLEGRQSLDYTLLLIICCLVVQLSLALCPSVFVRWLMLPWQSLNEVSQMKMVTPNSIGSSWKLVPKHCSTELKCDASALPLLLLLVVSSTLCLREEQLTNRGRQIGN